MRHSVLLKLMGVLVVVAAWESIAFASPTLVPHSWTILEAIVLMCGQESFQRDVGATLLRTALSFGLALLIGTPVGLLIGSLWWLNRAFMGPVDFARSIPGFVLLPVFLVIFKTGESARIAMAAFGVGIVIAANTAFAAAHVGRLRIEVARVYGAGIGYRLGVVFMQLLPQSLDGARVGLSLALVLTVVGEIMLGATQALGTRVNDNLSGFDLPRMYALILVIGILGYLLNLLASFVTSRVSRYGAHL